MPYSLEDLVVTRVDLVDEGANSAAFIELYKRKGSSDNMDAIEEVIKSMKPEHAELVTKALSQAKLDLDTAVAKEHDAGVATLAIVTADFEKAKADLKTANADLKTAQTDLKTAQDAAPCTCDGADDGTGTCKVCGKPKLKKAADGKASFDETETIKSMPEPAKTIFLKMRAQKEAAEEAVRKANEATATAEAVNKAASFKALPVEQEKIVGILKNATPELLEVLTTLNAAMESGVLDEVGHVTKHNDANKDSWAKIEAAADTIAKSKGVTKAKAVSLAIQENPELYKAYIDGGAN